MTSTPLGRLAHLGLLAAIAIAAGALGCGDEETAIDIELVPDVNINTIADVVSRIGSVVLVVDSVDGLYAPGEEAVSGDVQIKNADADTDLELVGVVAVPAGRLPRLRLLRGGLPDVPLDLRALGVTGATGDTQVAVGSVAGVTFTPNEIARVQMPFNLRPEMLPPRVMDVSPADGEAVIDCVVAVIVIVFSKPLEPASVNGAIALDPAPAAMEVVVRGRVVQLNVTGLEGLSYTLSISTDVADIDGNRLDQVAMQPGGQPFMQHFELRCIMRSDTPPPPCGSTEPSMFTPYCPSAELVCVDRVCEPSSCEGVSCPAGYVCDPSMAACDVDCRVYGGDEACAPPAWCDAATGTCIGG